MVTKSQATVPMVAIQTTAALQRTDQLRDERDGLTRDSYRGKELKDKKPSQLPLDARSISSEVRRESKSSFGLFFRLAGA